jgi:hypothetical protein
MRFLPARFALPVAAAIAAVAISGFSPAGTAVADHDQDAQYRDRGDHRELRRLRAELRAYKEAYAEAVEGLDDVERAANRMRDRRARQLGRLAERARDRASDMVRDYHDDDRGNDDDDYAYQPLTDAEFQAVYKRVAAASFADDQIALVKSVAKSSYFTVAQAATLMKACSFDDTRIEVAVILYPRIVDSRNWYQIEDALSFSSSKQTLRSRIGQ